MASLLASILKSLNIGWLKNMLLGAGITLGSAGISLTALNAVMDNFRNTITGMPPMALAFAHLAGIDIAMSLIFGAILARVTLKNTNLALKKAIK